MNKVAKFVAYLFWAIATGLYLTAMLTNYWANRTTRFNSINYGLFRECTIFGCRGIDWTSYDFTHMSIPRYIMFVGALLNVLGVLFGLIGFISKSSNDNTASKYYCLLKTEGIFYILGGIVILGACSAFTGINLSVTHFQNFYFGYSFYLGWISGLLYIAAGSCSIIAGRNPY